MDWDYSPPESVNGSDEDDEYTTDFVEDGSETGETEAREFDRNLPAEHSYLPGGLVTVQGRSVLEPGWIGKMPCWSHHSVLFPGETVPMLFTDALDSQAMQTIIESDKLFGLLFISSEQPQTYGVLCEVVEAAKVGEQHVFRSHLSFKVRARQRFIRLKNLDSDNSMGQRLLCEIKILPDIVLKDPLRDLKFRRSRTKSQSKTLVNKYIHKTDAVCTPWPRFVFDVFDAKVIVEEIKEYFKGFRLENLPKDLLSLSFWVATNLAIPTEDRLALFMTDSVLLRLFLESKHIKQKNRMLCCVVCMTEICDKEEITAMSNEGIFNNYCNIAGFVHDIMTVQRVNNVVLQGRPSIKFTWFPGYLWTIASCASCGGHVGWRFNANKKTLLPQEFWGLARKSLTSARMAQPI